MRAEYRKLKAILKKSLNVYFLESNLQKKLSADLEFSKWEVDYLLAKVENEFNITLVAIEEPNGITVNHLLKHIKSSAKSAIYR